jgi:predicted glycosyltransferase
MAIASHLRNQHTNILIITGSPIAGRFTFPDHIDFVRIPGMIKKTNEEYLPLSIKINPDHALDIRKNIIKVTAQTFQPDLFIVDKEPLGLKKEVLPTLKWLRRNLPNTRTILGLRDIMDESSSVRKDWKEKKVYKTLEELYTEIWVYGIKDFYDPITEYSIPESVSKKIIFTGYIPRKVPSKNAVKRFRNRHTANGEKLVVVTPGGGGDGYAMMDTFLSMMESEVSSTQFRSVLITGPFMKEEERNDISERAKKMGIKTWHFYKNMEKVLAAADLVVSMGGYNTVCEVLSQGTVSLIIPREIPRKEQLIRAQVLNNRNMVDYLQWNVLTPKTLLEKVLHLLEHPEPFQEVISHFQLTGLDVMGRCLEEFRNNKS